MSLDSLPSSKDKYWEHAETNQINMNDLVQRTPTCQHHFVSKSGRRAECNKCHIGYYLDPGLEVRQGGIYKQNTLII